MKKIKLVLSVMLAVAMTLSFAAIASADLGEGFLAKTDAEGITIERDGDIFTVGHDLEGNHDAIIAVTPALGDASTDFTFEISISSLGLNSPGGSDKEVTVGINMTNFEMFDYWTDKPQTYIVLSAGGVILWDDHYHDGAAWQPGPGEALVLVADPGEVPMYWDTYDATERWNDLKIQVKDGMLSVWLNEALILEDYEVVNPIPADAHVAFGSHMRSAGHTQRFTNVVLTRPGEEPATEAPATEAPATEAPATEAPGDFSSVALFAIPAVASLGAIAIIKKRK